MLVPPRSAHTLLELVMATAITSITLVPALVLFRDGMEMSEKISRRNTLASLAVDKLEEQLAVGGASWTNGVLSGDFAARGEPQIRFDVTRSDAASDGGIPGRLMSVAVTVFDDLNGNNNRSADEPAISFRSKIARLATYENKAN